MARRKNTYPDLKFHGSSGQWCIYHGNRRVTLGSDRDRAERRRLELIARWHGTPLELPPAPDSLTLAEALELYRRHVAGQNPDPRKLSRIDAAIGAAVPAFGHIRAASFRGPALKEVRKLLCGRRHPRTGRPLTRRYINHLVDALVLAFRWLVAEDLVPAENLARLREMSAELAETAGGRESVKAPAVDDAIVERTLPQCSPTVRAMIRVQRATGMRPGELCSMQRGEISTRPDEPVPIAGLDKRASAIAFQGELVWLYCPTRHKNLHRGKPRVIALGADAQRELRPFLDRDGIVFRNDSGQPWTPATYGGAVARACRRAGVDRWSPQQLRKAAAKRIDGVLNADHAAAMLGHSASRQAIDHYISEQIEKAVQAAAKAG